MNLIKLLPKDTIDKIAAGEVVVNGASVLKELLENSIDANSKNIIIEILHGGKTLIKVSDDGDGIFKEDIPNAFLRNATSKIESDIDSIKTLGFRGEALASISYVSKLTITTKTKSEEIGTRTWIEENKIINSSLVQSNKGTIIEVRDLFYNIPARYKHLKKDSVETSEIIDIAVQIALSHPEISFKLSCDNKDIFYSDGTNNLVNSISSLLGRDMIKHLLKIDFEDDPLFVSGYISSPSFIEDKSRCRMIFLNGRVIKCEAINQSVDSVYKEYCGKSGADFILYIKLPYSMIDVNIHPAKLTIKLLNESLITMLIKQGIRDVLKDNFIIKIDNKYSFYEAEKEVEHLIFEEAEKYIPNEFNKNHFSMDTNIEHFKPSAELSIIDNYDELLEIDINKSDETALFQEIQPFQNTINKEIFLHLCNMKFIGNAFGVYAMLESGDDIFAIDTHAAHERVLYEKYLKDFYSHNISIQTLMIPILIPLSVKYYQIILTNKHLLASLGFEIDDFADNTIAVRSMPHYLSNSDIKHIIEEIIEEIIHFGNIDDINKRSEKLIKNACHNAVRGNENINEAETKALLKDLYNTNMPFTCPHGRPILGKLKMSYFMKAFERI